MRVATNIELGPLSEGCNIGARLGIHLGKVVNGAVPGARAFVNSGGGTPLLQHTLAYVSGF